MLGLPSEQFAIDWGHLVLNMITIKGIYGREMFETWYKMASLLQSGLDLTPVITHHLPIQEFPEAFSIMGSGRSGKVILDWQTL
jgi:threonine 3-dehydrogenase